MARIEVRKIVLDYKPRYPEAHKKIRDARFAVLVAHRRFGKTVLSVNHLLREALFTRKQRGSYAYVAPYRNQAKVIAWDYLKHYSSPCVDRKVNEGELSIAFGNGATIRVFGADNPDALRGLYFDGIVMDEVAQMKPEVWHEIIRPALADRQGWALFIGTPKGANLFSELYHHAAAEQAKGNKDWCAMSFPVTQTEALSKDEIEALKTELSENAYKQEMLCDFNAASDDVLIPLDLVNEAMQRSYQEHVYINAPLVLGVDVARFGDDASVLFYRRGLVAERPIVVRKLDNMALADRVVSEIVQRKPDAVFVDAGQGAGVIDRVRQLGFDVTEVPFGSKALKQNRFFNRRMEMWHNCLEWLKTGGALPPDEGLKAELSCPTYSFNNAGLMQLEKKEDIKERLGHSCDEADALCLTFAAPVARAFDVTLAERRQEATKYDPLAW